MDDEKIISYVDAKILAQVNRIKDPTPQEIEEAGDYNSGSDFVMCTFPKYDEKEKLLGITEEVCLITILGDPQDNFYDNGFLNEKRRCGQDSREIGCLIQLYNAFFYEETYEGRVL